MEIPNQKVNIALNDVIKQQGFVNYKIVISPGANKGDNYGSVVYKATITGNKTNNEESTLKLFIKIMPPGMSSRPDYTIYHDAFLREIKVYNQILIEFKQLEEQIGVKDGFTSYAKCLATGTNDEEEFLILEDISTQNYAMFNRFEVIDLEHTKLVMKALGQLHALSFASRDQRPEVFNKYRHEIPELFALDDASMTDSIKSYLTQFLNNAVEKLKFDGHYQEKWENFHKNYLSILRNCVKGTLAEPYAIVCHADVWNNNIMFQYKNGVPSKVCLLDWQITRYASPALDVVHYLFGSVEKPLRDLYYKTLLDTYYESLSSFLKQLGSDPEKLYPYTTFQNQLKEFGIFGLAMGILVVPNIVNKSEDAVALEDLFENVSNVSTKNTSKWVKRLSDVVMDMVDLGYL